VWRDHVAQVARGLELPQRQVVPGLRRLVTTSITCTLMALALDDVLPPGMAMAAQGPWRATLSPSGTDPGQRWRCSQHAEQVVRTIFAAADARALLDIAEAVATAAGEVLSADRTTVLGLGLTRAVCPPPVHDLVRTQVRLTASFGPVQQQLTLFAQLIAAVVDGEYELNAEQARWFTDLLESCVVRSGGRGGMSWPLDQLL
jgi:hypothetical protein